MQRAGVVAVLLFFLALAGAANPAAAQAGLRDASALRAGQFVWLDAASFVPASTGGVSITISIPSQRAYVYRDGTLIGVSTVSTGKAGKETPVGEFTILQKKPFHRSNLYSNAPMPWMQRLTWTGIALHAGHLPGYPASHGCIRLPAAFARRLYDLTDLGATVSVVDYPVDELFDPYPQAPRLSTDIAGLGGDAFDVVTVGGSPPPALVPVRDDPAPRPVSWITGPAAEIVQPLPSNRN
jgi:hypothetical protein